MYNIAQHYENIYQYLKTIITDPRVAYLHPFGSTQPENLEIIRDDDSGYKRKDPLFIFYDQEPLNFVYNKPLFDYIKQNTMGPYILVSTEKHSAEKERICQEYNFANLDYFFHIFAATDWYRGHQYIPNIVLPSKRKIQKTYITFNRLTSGERIYRSLFINELYKSDLLESGYISYSKECPDGGNFADNLRMGVTNQKLNPTIVEEAITNISNIDSLRIDFAEDEYIPNQSMVLSPIKELMESFVFIVTETCYWQDKTHLTEKIFKPIVLRMPFILVGCVNNLAYLRDYGFKTFNEYWDESYDTIADPILRLQAITKIIKSLSELSSDQLQYMLNEMSPILEHNYKLFNSPDFVKNEWDHLTNSLTAISKLYKFEPPYSLNPRLGQAIPC
jgi:hypothetical protein